MYSPTLPFVAAVLACAIVHIDAATTTTVAPPKKVVNVGIGEHCSLGAAPVGPGGSWVVVEKNVEKVCAQGTSCRKGACNCDDLKDGTVTGMSFDSPEKETRVCRHIAGQKCSADSDCFLGVKCTGGKCTCDESKKDEHCVDSKNDVIILA